MNTVLALSPVSTRPLLTTPLLGWQEPLATRLRYRHSLPGRVANRLLNVELGLFLLAELLPTAPPEALPDLLNGQGVAYRERPVWTPKQHRSLNRARALLAPYQNRPVWYNALTRYAQLPAFLRVFTAQGTWNADLSTHAQRERLHLFGRALA